MITAEQVLDEAGHIIAKPENWTQGESVRVRDGVYSYCAGMAIRQAAGKLHINGAACLYAREALSYVLQGDIVPWNDDPLRQHSEVVEAFEKARAHAGEKGW